MTEGYGGSPGGPTKVSKTEPHSATQCADLDAARQQIAALTHALHEAEQGLISAGLRERALRAELQHRVRNMLAVVRSVFSRTADTYDAADDIADHFKGRLDALARSQTWATESDRHAIDLEALILEELLAAAAADDPRITIRGPAVRLSGKSAESIALAIHELVTNSVKFGVLSHAGDRGGLRIEWRLAARELDLVWRETGVTVLSAAPLRSGFGRDFIENSVPYQVDAATSFAIEPGAISCRIRMPFVGTNA